MKKVLIAVLVLCMVLSAGLMVSAETGAFMESPSRNQAPTLVESKNESEDCVAKLIITAYADRDELTDEVRAKIEDAYKVIVGTKDLSTLNTKVKEIAKKTGVEVKNLAVSDMFDISATDCGAHENHGHFDITLKSDTLKNFVCLLHYYNGEWRVVENAKVTQNGTHLEFTEDEFSPFAIVVDTNAQKTDVPETGDNRNIWVYAVIMAVSAIALIGILVISKKNKLD